MLRDGAFALGTQKEGGNDRVPVLACEVDKGNKRRVCRVHPYTHTHTNVFRISSSLSLCRVSVLGNLSLYVCIYAYLETLQENAICQ